MLITLSPAKKIHFSDRKIKEATEPQFLEEANCLAGQLKRLSASQLQELMKVSAPIAKLNETRYLNWQESPQKELTNQALFTFQGMAYFGLDADSLTEKAIAFAQKKLRILSGLYGVLRPLDLIQPYRLEMGTNISLDKHRNLYEFWGEKLTENLNRELEAQQDNVIVNLASNEYFKSLKKKKLNGKIITPIFKDDKGQGAKVITVYAKKARGLMTRFVLEHQLEKVEDLKAFDTEGYYFDPTTSTDAEWIFTREH